VTDPSLFVPLIGMPSHTFQEFNRLLEEKAGGGGDGGGGTGETVSIFWIGLLLNKGRGGLP